MHILKENQTHNNHQKTLLTRKKQNSLNVTTKDINHINQIQNLLRHKMMTISIPTTILSPGLINQSQS